MLLLKNRRETACRLHPDIQSEIYATGSPTLKLQADSCYMNHLDLVNLEVSYLEGSNNY